MGTHKKTEYFQRLRAYVSPPASALILIALAMLIPSRPFEDESTHWIESDDASLESDSHRLLKVYSVLRRQTDLRDSRAWAIAETILLESKQHALDPLLILAVINVESSFQQTAASNIGARGLMQIRPDVAKYLAEKGEFIYWTEQPESIPDLLYDPIVNIKLGVFYLHWLTRSFRDLKLALTAYNWGPTEIRNRLAEEEAVPFEYAMKVLSAYETYRKEIQID